MLRRTRDRSSRVIARFMLSLPKLQNTVDPFSLEPVGARPPYVVLPDSTSVKRGRRSCFVFELSQLYRYSIVNNGVLKNVLSNEPLSLEAIHCCARAFKRHANQLRADPEVIDLIAQQETQATEASQVGEAILHMIIESVEELSRLWIDGHDHTVEEIADLQILIAHAMTIDAGNVVLRFFDVMQAEISALGRLATPLPARIEEIWAHNFRSLTRSVGGFMRAVLMAEEAGPAARALADHVVDYETALVHMAGEFFGWERLRWAYVAPPSIALPQNQ